MCLTKEAMNKKEKDSSEKKLTLQMFKTLNYECNDKE